MTEVFLHNRLTDPRPIPLAKISHTTYEVLRVCSLRQAFSQDPYYRSRSIMSHALALGIAAHDLIDKVNKGFFNDIEINDLRSKLTETWEALVSNQNEKLFEAAGQNSPPPNRWSGYNMKKAATLRYAHKLVLARKDSQDPAVVNLRSESERPYEGFDQRMTGTVDRVITNVDGVELIDYKSAPIREDAESGEGKGELKDEYKRQMLLYSALHHYETGNWPLKTTVTSLTTGDSISNEASPEEATLCADEALQMRDRYNSNAENGEIQGEASPESCGWCKFKGPCSSFFDSITIDWDIFRVHIKGTVIRKDLRNGLNILVVAVENGNVEGGNYDVYGIPTHFFDHLSEGINVSLVNLVQSIEPNRFGYRWNSQLWIWG